MRLLLVVLLLAAQAWPSALSLSSAEVQPGQTLTAVATAPEGATVALQLPVGVSAELLERQGQTVRWRLTVASSAPLSRVPVVVVLLVDGRMAAVASLRVWTEEVRSFRIALPFILQKRG